MNAEDIVGTTFTNLTVTRYVGWDAEKTLSTKPRGKSK